jgi:hypothetical protein
MPESRTPDTPAEALERWRAMLAKTSDELDRVSGRTVNGARVCVCGSCGWEHLFRLTVSARLLPVALATGPRSRTLTAPAHTGHVISRSGKLVAFVCSPAFIFSLPSPHH